MKEKMILIAELTDRNKFADECKIQREIRRDRMGQTVCLTLALVLLCLRSSGIALAADRAGEEQLAIRTWGVKLNVDDMDKALSFYRDKLGFEVEDRQLYPRQVFLKAGDRVKLILNAVKKLRRLTPDDTKAAFTLQVNDLDQSIARMKSLGVEFAETEKRKEGVGYAISILDPFGRNISLMHQTIVKVEPFKEPKLYNFGYRVPEMQAARDFYANKLGFTVRSEKYLPLDLPLGHKDNTFAFMLHYRPNIQPIQSAYPAAVPLNVFVFETADLKKAIAALKKAGVKVLHERPQNSSLGSFVAFEDPFGNVSDLFLERRHHFPSDDSEDFVQRHIGDVGHNGYDRAFRGQEA